MANIDNDFKIKFDGSNEIDANVLINSLLHTSNIIHEINRYLDTDKKIDIKVKALEKGSFVVHIEMVETVLDTLKHMFTSENINVTASILATLTGVIEIRKFLKSDKPKKEQVKGDKTTIINGDGNKMEVTTNVYNIYSSSEVVKDALAQNFQSLKTDPAITGFEITDKNEKPLVRVGREDFESMAIKEIVNDGNNKLITEVATLNIIRLSFETNMKWDFYYKGHKISARIKDPKFYDEIDKGIAFSKGDTLEVDLEIKQEFNSSVNTFVNTGYSVTRIIKHTPRGKQSKIDWSDDNDTTL